MINATIFTYSFGNENLKEVPHKISCDHHGVWEEIIDSTD